MLESVDSPNRWIDNLLYLGRACVYLGEGVFSLLLAFEHGFNNTWMVTSEIHKTCLHTRLN